MNDEKYRYRRLAYIITGILIPIFALLLLILGLATFKGGGKPVVITSIVIFVLAIIYYFFAQVKIFSLKNRYKEFVISDAFLTYQFDYYSRQLGIMSNKYKIDKYEFEDLNYYKTRPDYKFYCNELVVGSIRDVQFRSEDYKYLTDKGNTNKCGRIYALNLKSDEAFKLIITKEDYSTNLKKMNINLGNYNVYTNNIDLASKYILVDQFMENITKLEEFGPLFFEVYNRSLYLIIDGIKNSFIIEDREYFDIQGDVENEIMIINGIIDSFKFTMPEKKEKPFIIK